jgi:hypothetical protein
MSLADPTAPWYAYATQQRLLDRMTGRITPEENRRRAAEITAGVWADTHPANRPGWAREPSSLAILVRGAA